MNRKGAYESIKDFVVENITDYSQKIVIDIHRDGSSEEEVADDGVALIVAKGNSNFELNEKFARQLKENIKEADSSITTVIHFVNSAVYNQDISNMAIRVQIARLNTKSEIIERNIEALAHALASMVQ